LTHLSHQNRQNFCNPAAFVEATPAVKISGITLLGLLLAIAGLVKTVLSVGGVSALLKQMDLVIAGVFGLMYSQNVGLCHAFHLLIACPNM
jgi:hypothetical protein